MKQTVLIIDAGHGGLDPITGKYATPEKIGKKTLHTNGQLYHGGGWFYEGVSNRKFATDFIRQASTEFVCCPVFHPWHDTPLNNRVAMANTIFEKMQAHCVFLSFHSNAFGSNFAPQTAAHGVTLHTLFKNGGAADIANVIAPGLNERFGDYGSRRPDNWPLKFELDIHITRHTKMPAIVLEVGFFDNPKDADILMNPFAIMEFNKTLLEELKNELI